MMNLRICFLYILQFSLLLFFSVDAKGHGPNMLIGHSAGGQLKVMEVPQDKFLLDPVNNLFFQGWNNGDLGFGFPFSDDPNNDFFVLENGFHLLLAPVVLKEGLEVHHLSEGERIDYLSDPGDPNDYVTIGSSHLDLVWYINQSMVGVDWLGCLQGTFKLVDTGTTDYAESEPFTIQFTNDPNPLSTDLNNDEWVNMIDFGLFSAQWLENNCHDPNWCYGTDLNKSGTVDREDLFKMIKGWLQ